jgi:phosphate-selective porin OprO/OprP
MSEYTSAEIDDTPYGDLRLDGYYVAASWILTKEMRPYNHKSGILQPVPVSNPVNTGGWGAWEIAARYSTIDLTDKSLIGGEADVYTIGLNWWMQSSMLFSVSLQHAELDKPPLIGGPIITGDATGIVSRLLLILE